MNSFIIYLQNNQSLFVNALLKGYRNYIDERIIKDKEMLVSGGYAWTKSNHIESTLGQDLNEKNDGRINVVSDKAGYSWKYLQFHDKETKCIMMLRESTSLSPNIKRDSCPEYLRNYIQLNGVLHNSSKHNVQGTLWDNIPNVIEEDMNNSIKNIDGQSKFYILTYSIDSITKDINRIELKQPQFNKSHQLVLNHIMTFDIASDNPYLLDESRYKQLKDMDDDIMVGNAITYEYSNDQYDIDSSEEHIKEIN